MIRVFRMLWVILATLALFAAACSDDGPSDQSSPTPGDVSDPTAGDGSDPTGSPAGDPSLAPDMIRIEGTVSGGTMDAVYDGPAAGPFTLRVPSAGGGNGAVVNPVTIDGESKSIVWDGGRPLTLTGGDLRLDGLWHVGGGVALALGDNVVRLPTGTYRLAGPVAVGDPSGLAAPHDQVTFDAVAETAILGTGTSNLAIPGGGVFLGPGSLDLQGRFTVTTATGAADAASVQVADNSFELTLSVADDGSVSISGLARDAVVGRVTP